MEKAHPEKKRERQAEVEKSGRAATRAARLLSSGRYRSPFLRRNWDLLFFLAYAAVLAAFKIPNLRWDYDIGHHCGLLMTSIRIWGGQVPYRDFFPWYGPLCHYFLALLVGPMGNNLYSIKIFDLISFLLCMAILILVLRQLELPALPRFFALVATVVFGLERVYFCGSLRPFLPILVIALWYRGYRRRIRLITFFIFPSVAGPFFFSPETGVYLLPAAFVFAGLALLLLKTRRERLRFLLWSWAGLVTGAFCLVLLFFTAGWFRNYLAVVSGLSDNFRWSSGMSLPGLSGVVEEPLDVFYYLPVFIYAAAGLILLGSWIKTRALSGLSLWAFTVIAFGVCLWYSASVRVSSSHLKSAFLPTVIIASLSLAGKFKPFRPLKLAVPVALVFFLLAGAIFFKSRLLPHFKADNYEMLMGVRVDPQEKMIFDEIKKFADGHDKSQIGFPLKSFYYAWLGMVPTIPFDGPEWPMYPGNAAAYTEAVRNLNARYMIIYEQDIFWSVPIEVMTSLLDYIDENYEPIISRKPLWIYEKRPGPVPISEVLAESHKSYELNPSNHFQLVFSVPQLPSVDQEDIYLEFNAEFEYPNNFSRRSSLPIAEWEFDGRRWIQQRPEFGTQRMNTTRGKHPYRMYLFYPAKQLKLIVDFPGAFNFQPSKIIISDIKWHLVLDTFKTPRVAL